MSYGETVREELRAPTHALLHDATLAPGALDVMTKELIAHTEQMSAG